MSLRQLKLVLIVTFALLAITTAETFVQLNINRPFNDVSENFISYSMRPEDLYKALDGPNRKSMTRLASMLGDAYIKFIGDFHFAGDSEFKLRNPTKIIWKGFNRWTRAVNWTMIIPLPYTPKSWDPMVALKILNTSYLVGITDCIWQLGTDFTSSKAQDYVNELETLNLMVDSYRANVEDWQLMGADITAGSSADETRNYVDLSKNINTAFGWTQPEKLMNSNGMGGYIYLQDPALKVLLNKKVSTWLSLPQPRGSSSSSSGKQSNNQIVKDDVTEGLRWAQTIGDAASSGFDVIFKKISLSDVERPDLSVYATILFKKIMGSRVFPARPLNIFQTHNKLYTHCANAISGAIAFMLVNPSETPLELAIRSPTKMKGIDVWQYTLTTKKGSVLLNGKKLFLNSTLSPKIEVRNADSEVELTTPGKSISFWVLRNVNLEHCQYTEIEAKEAALVDSSERVIQKRYSSSDKLLKKLIQETSMPRHSFLRGLTGGDRRYATFKNRAKRFILEDKDSAKGLGKLFEPMAMTKEKTIEKRESVPLEETRADPWSWIESFMKSMSPVVAPRSKRSTRSVNNYFGSMFSNTNKKNTGMTKKIFDIRKPEKNTKPIFDLEHFDEEEFFKKMSEHSEPEYRRLPEGDVHLTHIANAEGEDIDDDERARNERMERKRHPKAAKYDSDDSNEAEIQMKPLRLLPTDFYAGLQPKKNKLGTSSAISSLFFPNLSNKSLVRPSKNFVNKVVEENVHEDDTENRKTSTQNSKDFALEQQELSKYYFREEEKASSKETEEEDLGKPADIILKSIDTSKAQTNRKYIDLMAEKSPSQSNEDANDEETQPESKEPISVEDQQVKSLEELTPWWDIGSIGKASAANTRSRSRRSLPNEISDELWRTNMIDKYEDLTPLGATMPQQMVKYEYKIDKNEPNKVTVAAEKEMDDKSFSTKIVATVKDKVSKFVDIVAHHVNAWYNTLSKHIDEAATTISEDSPVTNKVK